MIPRFQRTAKLGILIVLAIGITQASGQTPLNTPQTGVCETSPLTSKSLAEITGTTGPGDASNNSASAETLLATGSPADDPIRLIAENIVDEFVSCTNAGKVMSVLALGTDNFIRAYANWAMPGNLLTSDLGIHPDRITLQEINPIRSYRDGSIAAFAQIVPGYSGNEFQTIIFVLIQENDTWKIASIIPEVTYRSGAEVPVIAFPATPPASPEA